MCVCVCVCVCVNIYNKKVFIAHVLDYRNAIEWGLNNTKQAQDGTKQVRCYLIYYACSTT